MVFVFKDNKFLIKTNLCKSFLSKGLGLMFTFKPKSVLLKNNYESIIGSGIHMFFMFYSIDIYWLDKNLKVVDIKKSLKPFTINHFPKNKAMYTLEVPCNSIKLEIGDTIHI